jgi:hypothetical protein
MSYIGNSPGVASQRVTTTLTATAGQTQFTTQSGYVLGYVDVYLNGAKLVNGSDFEAISGTYITLFAGALANDVVELISYVPRGLTDGYTKAEADAKFLDVGGDTASGNLSFATASLSGNLTLGGGTAGGIGYLNGSKVLTTGSALVFDGANLGIGVASPTVRLQTFTSGVSTQAFFESGTGLSVIRFKDSNTTDTFPPQFGSAGNSLFWQIAGSEQMRLNSTGLGIGTSSPTQKLDVNGNIVAGINGFIGLRRSDGLVVSTLSNVGDSETRITASGGGAFATINVNGSERLRVTENANLGLGVVPSSGDPYYSRLELGKAGCGLAAATISLTNSELTYLTGNAVAKYTGGNPWTYGNVGNAAIYAIEDGTHSWSVAGSGTAGNAISFTQAMVLDNSGRLTITSVGLDNTLTLTSTAGAYSSRINMLSSSGGGSVVNVSQWFGLLTNGTERVRVDSVGNLMVGTTTPSAATGSIGSITIGGSNANVSGSLAFQRNGYVDAYIYRDTDGAFFFQSLASGGIKWSSGSSTERMRLNTSGGLSIGTTNDPGAGNINLGNGNFLGWGNLDTLIVGNSASNFMYFRTGGAEKARIDASGNLLVGGSSTGAVDPGSPQINLISGVTGSGQWTGRIVSRNTGNNTAVFLGNYKSSQTIAVVAAHSAALDAWTPLYVNTVDGTSNNGGNVIIGGRLGIGTVSPVVNAKVDVNGAIKSSRTVYNWYSWGGNPSGRYHHIKTSLWSGGGGSNSQPTMSLFHIKGYNYDAHTIDAMIGFHNWSGAQYSLRVSNSGSYAGLHGTYTSADGYVVLVIDTGANYPGISIDYHQSFPYNYQDVGVVANSSSTSSTGVY